MTHPVDSHVGKRLRLRRKMLGFSQEDLGKSVGITFQQVQKYERGTNRICSSRLYEFAKILSVPVSYFFEEFEAAGFAEGEAPFEHEAQVAKQDLENKETMSLVQAYYRIDDPMVRNKVLSLIKSLEKTG